jgi:hypothetical protein
MYVSDGWGSWGKKHTMAQKIAELAKRATAQIQLERAHGKVIAQKQADVDKELAVRTAREIMVGFEHRLLSHSDCLRPWERLMTLVFPRDSQHDDKELMDRHQIVGVTPRNIRGVAAEVYSQVKAMDPDFHLSLRVEEDKCARGYGIPGSRVIGLYVGWELPDEADVPDIKPPGEVPDKVVLPPGATPPP